jgi:uncharacterized membrane protein YjgN (DUF898 family)
MKNIKEFTVTHTSYGGQTGLFFAKGGSFFSIYFMSGLILILFAIVSVVATAVGIRLVNGNPYFPLIMTFPVYIGYIFAFAYVKAHITNIVWKNIKIGPVFFESRFRTMELVRLYFGNAVGIIVSAGLLIPWAVIRTLRYRVEHTHVYHSGPLTTFSGDHRKTVAATGAELIDFFDLDLSL